MKNYSKTHAEYQAMLDEAEARAGRRARREAEGIEPHSYGLPYEYSEEYFLEDN